MSAKRIVEPTKDRSIAMPMVAHAERASAPTKSFRNAIVLTLLTALALLVLGTTARAAESNWPRQFDSPSGTFVIYQPQPEGLAGDLLASRAAFSLQKSVDATPIFGVLWFTERLEIDRDSSTVAGRDLQVGKVRLPGITPEEAERYETLVETEASQWDLSGSLAELQAGLAATERERASVAGLDNEPPRIEFVYENAFLLPYDGAPTLEPLEGTKLEWVSNTPYAVILDPSSGDYYLGGSNLWYRARDPLGPWTAISDPPATVSAVMPPDSAAAADPIEGPPPRVVTATVPTELISIDGQPQYASLVGDELLYIANTESDVVRMVSTQLLYVLLAGRWFTAETPAGPWTFVRGDQLPEVFRRVPPDSPKGNILASVAGTEQADDAVADAGIPQTSAILRGEADLLVVYDGPPRFEPIEGTSLQYAVNTDAEVILADGRYYLCDQGVWYVADDPEGPWWVSETRPLGVDDIPPSYPVYDVRYVYIYEVTPDYVYMGYLPAYLGFYPYYGTVVYGTGYHYRPWRGRRYFARPWTWGFHARYNPWLGRWGYGCTFNSRLLRAGYHWRRGPHFGNHYDRPRWFGSGGYRRPQVGSDLALLRRRPPGRVPLRDTPSNLYRRPANAKRVDDRASRLPLHPIAPQPARKVVRPNDIFAGQDGKVYQRDARGSWKVNDGHVWKATPIPNKPVPASGVSKATGSSRPNAKPLPSQPSAPAKRGQARVEPVPAPPVVQPVSPTKPSRARVLQPAAPTPTKVAPVLRDGPGNLEREFQARQRSGDTAPKDVRPAQKPEPAKPQPSKPAPKEKAKTKAPSKKKS